LLDIFVIKSNRSPVYSKTIRDKSAALVSLDLDRLLYAGVKQNSRKMVPLCDGWFLLFVYIDE